MSIPEPEGGPEYQYESNLKEQQELVRANIAALNQRTAVMVAMLREQSLIAQAGMGTAGAAYESRITAAAESFQEKQAEYAARLEQGQQDLAQAGTDTDGIDPESLTEITPIEIAPGEPGAFFVPPVDNSLADCTAADVTAAIQAAFGGVIDPTLLPALEQLTTELKQLRLDLIDQLTKVKSALHKTVQYAQDMHASLGNADDAETLKAQLVSELQGLLD